MVIDIMLFHILKYKTVNMHCKWGMGNIMIADSTHNLYSPCTFTVRSEKICPFSLWIHKAWHWFSLCSPFLSQETSKLQFQSLWLSSPSVRHLGLPVGLCRSSKKHFALTKLQRGFFSWGGLAKCLKESHSASVLKWRERLCIYAGARPKAHFQ